MDDGTDTTRPTEFDVWGCRGSRNLPAGRSRIGVRTSCYSTLSGDTLFTFDAGRGLVELGGAMLSQPRFAGVRRVFVLITHAHLDHWEGLKDVDWFWRKGGRLEVTLIGPEEALSTVRRCFQEPSYVPLQVLAAGTLARFDSREVQAGERLTLGPARLSTFALHHYSGTPEQMCPLDAHGYVLELPDGAKLAYLSDHEPTPATRATEDAMLVGTHVAIYDAHFADVRDHAFGHGSQEHTADVARRHPATRVFAGHHGPHLDDEMVHAAHRRHGRELANFTLAVEGETWRWDRPSSRFGRVEPAGRG